MALAGFGLAWAPNLPLAYVWSVPFGLGGAAFIAGANAITQQECPPSMRSRLLALQAVAFLGSTPIGGPLTGLIADNISAEWALAYSSVISLVCVTVAAAYWRAGRTADVPRLDVVPDAVPDPSMERPAPSV
jgi:MFS family permease